MKLIVGLGNPGKEYTNTRHNIGFMVIDHYLKNEAFQEKFKAQYCKKNIAGEIIYFVKPLTYMNLSGNSVREFVNFFNISLEDILVIQDDLDQPFGAYKLKKNSSSGGHNGIKSIIENLGSDSFLRLKIGIKNETCISKIDFVLKTFSSSELEQIKEMSETFDEIITSFITNGPDKTMNKYNTK